MKNLIIFLSTCLAIVSLSLNAQSNFQSAYYITNQSDTIHGEIDNRGDIRNCHICTFRSDGDAQSFSFEPGDILAYRFNESGTYYISKEVKINNEDQVVFLEYLVNGISKLYYYRGEGQDRYYIESQHGLMTELTNDMIEFSVNGADYARKSNLYVGQIKAAFGDCPDLQSKLDRAQFSHNSLIKLTSEYHDYVCDGQRCIIYEKALPKIRVSGGPYLGFMSSSLDFGSYQGTDQDFNADASYKWYHYYTFQKQTNLILGLRFRFTLPRISEKLALIALTEYLQSDYTAYYEDQTNPGLLTQMDCLAHTSTLNIMTGLQYNYPKGDIRPSLTIGPVFGMDLGSYFEIEHFMITDSREIVQNFKTEPIGGLVLGAFSELGADWSIHGPHHLGCNLRYHLTRQISDHYINRSGLSLSLYYNFAFN